MTTAWIGLGGNLGDVRLAMAAALQHIDGHGSLSVEHVSDVYKTPPWGLEDQPWFLNCCASVATELDPLDLLAVCQEAERLGHRERSVRWGPRTIDVDLLVFQGVQRDDSVLTLPHPRMSERAFVLVPLAEIAPTLPLGGTSVADLAENIDQDGIECLKIGRNWRRPVS